MIISLSISAKVVNTRNSKNESHEKYLGKKQDSSRHTYIWTLTCMRHSVAINANYVDVAMASRLNVSTGTQSRLLTTTALPVSSAPSDTVTVSLICTFPTT